MKKLANKALEPGARAGLELDQVLLRFTGCCSRRDPNRKVLSP